MNIVQSLQWYPKILEVLDKYTLRIIEVSAILLEALLIYTK